MTNYHKLGSGQVGALKVTENCSVTNLEARSLKVLARLVLSGGSGGESVLFLLTASAGSLPSLVVIGLQAGLLTA